MSSAEDPLRRTRRTRLLRPLLVLFAVGVLMVACGSGSGDTSVVVEPLTIEVSQDRRVVTVETSYPVDGLEGCPPAPTGVTIALDGNIAEVVALFEPGSPTTACQAECGIVTQTVTMDEPLPDDVRWTWPKTASPGCSPSQMSRSSSP